MGLTNFPNGIYANPIVGGGPSYAGYWNTNVWYVNGTVGVGSDSYTGKAMDRPFATIQKAIDVASANDTIYIKPINPASATASQGEPSYYVEFLDIPVAKTGLKLIGTSSDINPYFGAKIRPLDTTAGAVITVHAPNVTIANICVHKRANNLAGILLKGGPVNYVTEAGSCGAQINNCEIRYGAAATAAGIVIEGGYETVISGCTFVSCACGIYTNVGGLVSRGLQILDCKFQDNNGAVVANHITSAAGNRGFVIKDCVFGAATNFITIGASNSGVIAACYFDDLVATLANSTGKVTIPVGELVAVTGCWGGISLAVVQSQA